MLFMSSAPPLPIEDVSGEEWDGIGAAMRAADAERARRSAGHHVEGTAPTRDVEDLVALPPRLQRHRPRGLKVTDLAAQEWCERELAFTLSRGRHETAEMAAGTARHAELEAEVIERVDVDAESLEDRWALRALDLHVGLAQLRETGMTRELPVFGWLLPRGDQASFTSGVVDELWLSDGVVRVVDHKTRASPTLPTEAQARTTMMQLMAYKVLFDAIVTRGVDPDGRVSRRVGLRPDAALSDTVAAHAFESLGDGLLSVGAVTTSAVFDAVSREATRTPTSSNTLYVEYEWQRDGSALGETRVEFDRRWFESRVERHVSFWDGSRDGWRPGGTARVEDHPEDSNDAATRGHVRGVSDDEAWKCERCRFSSDCPTAAEFAERWQRRRSAAGREARERVVDGCRSLASK